MNGMLLVQQRIDAIEARFSPPKSVATVEDTAAGEFDSVMAEITDDQRALRSFGLAPAPSSPYRGPTRIGNPPVVSPALREAFESAAARYGLDVDLLMAVAWQESGFNPEAVSHAGAIGLMQLMPGTAAGLGVDPRNPIENIDGGARYLRQQLDNFGSIELALAAYNAGPGSVQRHGGIPPFAETQAYVPAVLGRWNRLEGGGAAPVSAAPPAAMPISAPAASPTVSGAPDGNGAPSAAVTAPTTAAAEATDGLPSPLPTPTAIAQPRATEPEATPAAPSASSTTTGDASTPAAAPSSTAPAAAGASANVATVAVETTGDGSDGTSAGDPDSRPTEATAPVVVGGRAGPGALVEPMPAVGATVSTRAIPAEVLRMVRQDGGVLRVQLSPQGLGDVSIQVSLTTRGDIAIEIMADTDQAATVIGRLRETVESALRVEGFSLDSFDVGTNRSSADQNGDLASPHDPTENNDTPRADSELVEPDRDAGAGTHGSAHDSIDASSDDPSVLRI